MEGWIRIRVEVKIRIRINVMRIRKTEENHTYHQKERFNIILLKEHH